MLLSRTKSVAAGILLASSVTVTVIGQSAQAAVPVEDMSTSGARSPDTVAAPAGSGGYPGYESDAIPVGSVAGTSGATGAAQLQPGQNAQLFYELQQLQTELLQLRGLVENQAYEIKRLQDLQRSQYLDIDRRLTGQDPASANTGKSLVAQASPEPSSSPPSSPPAAPKVPVVQTGEVRDSVALAPSVTPSLVPSSEQAAVASNTESSQTTVASEPAPIVEPEPVPAAVATQEPAPQPAAVATEQEAYARAFGLMKDQQFEQSIAAYQGVIQNYPGGSYAPESRYWLGELFLMSNRLEDARSSFNLVVDEFPAHQKVPLSLYKLGVVNHRLGGTTEALTYLDDVVVRYPDTPAAGLARTYAAELR